MKTIEPINIWINGTVQLATIFDLNCVYDNMFDYAEFSYSLKNNDLSVLSNSNITMVLPDYETDWQTNDAAYLWAATQLGLVITGDYVAPVIE